MWFVVDVCAVIVVFYLLLAFSIVHELLYLRPVAITKSTFKHSYLSMPYTRQSYYLALQA